MTQLAWEPTGEAKRTESGPDYLAARTDAAALLIRVQVHHVQGVKMGEANPLKRSEPVDGRLDELER